MYNGVLAERVRYYKESEEGATAMCEAVERLCNKAARQEKIHTARLMLDSGKFNYEEISQYTELPVETIRELDERASA